MLKTAKDRKFGDLETGSGMDEVSERQQSFVKHSNGIHGSLTMSDIRYEEWTGKMMK